MFNVIYNEKVKLGSNTVERYNTVSVSQDHLSYFGKVKYCEVACTGDTSDGFCVYVNEKPKSTTTLCDNNKKFRIIGRKCADRFEDEENYINTLNCMHYLAKAINTAYMQGEDQFNVNDWLVAHNYA